MTQFNIKREALRKPNQKKKKILPIFQHLIHTEIDYKDLKVLTRYVSEKVKLYRLGYLQYLPKDKESSLRLSREQDS